MSPSPNSATVISLPEIAGTGVHTPPFKELSKSILSIPSLLRKYTVVGSSALIVKH
ncbi:MAG: hypothetical protein MJ233_05010 [Mycoplasmoidaceae bacterium]|nr:hypothetical protein [Mycoplasmoidaceae bacterium]